MRSSESAKHYCCCHHLRRSDILRKTINPICYTDTYNRYKAIYLFPLKKKVTLFDRLLAKTATLILLSIVKPLYNVNSLFLPSRMSVYYSTLWIWDIYVLICSKQCGRCDTILVDLMRPLKACPGSLLSPLCRENKPLTRLSEGWETKSKSSLHFWLEKFSKYQKSQLDWSQDNHSYVWFIEKYW